MHSVISFLSAKFTLTRLTILLFVIRSVQKVHSWVVFWVSSVLLSVFKMHDLTLQDLMLMELMLMELIKVVSDLYRPLLLRWLTLQTNEQQVLIAPYSEMALIPCAHAFVLFASTVVLIGSGCHVCRSNIDMACSKELHSTVVRCWQWWAKQYWLLTIAFTRSA